MTINEYFPRVFVINLARRTDRLAEFETECRQHGITYERFEAYSDLEHEGRPHGGFGCTSSHRALLEIIAYHKIERALIFEDDAKFIYPDTQARFAAMIGSVPEDWERGGLFLGAHYGEAPQARVNEHVIRCNRMLTTHAYAVTWRSARAMAPYIGGAGGAIDSQYGQFHVRDPWYCLDPRLVIQRKGHSDLQEKFTDYEWVYTTKRHTWGELP